METNANDKLSSSEPVGQQNQDHEMSHDDEEEKKYDRQLRLWGVDAQKRMHNAKILLLGFNGLASETAKILALAGVNHITIVAQKLGDAFDYSSNLFCGRETNQKFRDKGDEIITKINWLNPRATVKYEEHDNYSTSIVSDYLKEFDVVCLSELLPIDEICRINDICREQDVMFYAQIDFGLFGFVFNDLGSSYKFSHEEFEQDKTEHIAVIEDDDDNDKPGTSISPSKTQLALMTIDDSDEGEGDENNGDLDESAKQRGTKRRRLDSPEEKTIKKTMTETTTITTSATIYTNTKTTPKISKSEPVERKKITKETILRYVSFRDMLGHKSFNAVTSPALILTLAILKYYDKCGTKPENYSEQLEPFVKLVLEDTKLDVNKVMKRLSFDWEDFLVGSWAPLTTIVGGLSGQDILRAVSHKFIPLYNTYTFDGSNLRGTVDKIGFSNSV